MESQTIGAVGAALSAPAPGSGAAPDKAKPFAPASSASHDDAKAAEAAAGRPGGSDIPQRDPRSLQFQVDGHRVITTIIDENNKTVVVQIPDAEVIRIAKSIDRMQGFLLEQKA